MATYASFVTDNHAELYDKFRPDHPSELYEIILKYLSEKDNGPYTLAVDVGCGSGQSTLPLAPYFQQVIGLDSSEAQIKQAKKHVTSNVHFQVGSACKMPVDIYSADLVTAGCAIHWFSSEQDFYKEVDQVLKPSGCLAVYSQTLPYLTINTCDVIFQEWMNTVRPYMSECILSIIRDKYTGLKLPLSDIRRYDHINKTCAMSLTTFCGLLRSYSFVQNYQEKNPNKADHTEVIEQRLQTILDPSGSTEADKLYIDVVFEYVLLIGQKPLSH